MHVHLIGVCGTGMGSLAGLLRQAGHRVTGSDTAFYPPMGDALARWGVETLTGYSPRHLAERPDLVVIGNVCRRDNVEAQAAFEQKLPFASFPGALRKLFLEPCRRLVVAGTHGKTTTSALLTFLLERTGRQPGFLIGGLPQDFETSFRAGQPNGPFVVEGDEYDSAFFEKTPKFWQYGPDVAVVHSVEHDHIDIYPDMESYRHAFERFVALLPAQGVLVINAADAEVVRLSAHCKAHVRGYAIEGEVTFATAAYVARGLRNEGEHVRFELLVDGVVQGDFSSAMSGKHNVRNALAALAMAHEGAGVPLDELRACLPAFRGVQRRQELKGTANGVRVYDDFAHHPTAVQETLSGLRARHPRGKLFAVFEPRSATASRRLHQTQYPEAFSAADVSILAPVGRADIPEPERLDVALVTAALRARGQDAVTLASVDDIVEYIAKRSQPGDTVVVMSNGAFGGIHGKLLTRLGTVATTIA